MDNDVWGSILDTIGDVSSSYFDYRAKKSTPPATATPTGATTQPSANPLPGWLGFYPQAETKGAQPVPLGGNQNLFIYGAMFLLVMVGVLAFSRR